jgi:hypothetical protein
MGVTAVLYVLMSYPTSLLARYVEQRTAIPQPGGARPEIRAHN